MSPRRLLRALRDPGRQAFVVLFFLVLAGFVAMGVAWDGAAATPQVPLQVPWLMSGGLGGLALLALALMAWDVHLGRRQDAVSRLRVDELVKEACILIEEERRRTLGE